MTRHFAIRIIAIIALAILVLADVHAQQKVHRRIGASVSYVSSGTFYFNAGRSRGLEIGDTVIISRKLQLRAIGVILAVSSSSSSATILSQTGPIAAGDSVTVGKEVSLEQNVPTPVTSQLSSRSEPRRVTGRLALQYGAAGEFGKSLDFSQPAAVLRLEIARLFNTAATLTFYGRTYYDLSEQFSRYGEGSRAKLRAYELSLTNENPRQWYGWGIGRISSRFVGGMGTFDGAQVYVRKGDFSIGTLAGAQANYNTSSIDTDQLKFAAFINYAWGGDAFRTSDVTLAYGQQRYKGKIDRTFMYMQSSLRFGNEFFVYSSSEFDFSRIDNGVRTKAMRLSNTFVTLSYMPLEWLSVNAGYDAFRTIYLFESMKSISDTLFDKTLKEGYRASVSFRLPLNVTVGGQVNFRLASGSSSNAHTLGTTFRVSDILGSEVNVGFQYANIVGLYTEGNDYTIDVDRWIAQSLSVAIRFDRFMYNINGLSEKLTTTTLGGSVNCRISRTLYAVINFDQMWDNPQDTQRLYLEVGIHF